MMKTTAVVLLLVTVAYASLAAYTFCHAAPFLISDPWPAADAQPDTCTAIESGAPIPLTLIDAAPGSKQLKHDVGGLGNGAHNWEISCANAFGMSAAVPFVFAAGAPGAPAGLRLAP